MTRAPRTLAMIDTGGATTSVALVVRIDRRWRLLGSMAGPVEIPHAALLGALAERVRTADAELATWPELRDSDLEAIPLLTARSRPPGLVLVLGASRRTVGDLEAEARQTGWRVATASTETHDPREMTALGLDPTVDLVLIGISDPPGPDERAALDDLAALGGALMQRRSDLRIMTSAAIRSRRAWVDALGDADPESERVIDVPAGTGRRGERDALRRALDDLRQDPEDGRIGMRAVTGTLAELLDLRVELLEVGFDGGVRLMAEPGIAGAEPTVRGVITAAGALVPPEPGDDTVDEVLAWTTGSLDRHRMSDRLRDLRRRPWVDGTGDGSRLRIAAASAALTRLAALTPELGAGSPPDLTIIAGGAFAGAPAHAVAMAVADTIRRAGSTQLAWDHARLLGPIGTIEDPGERRSLLADLAHDGLVPLGSLVIVGGAGGARPGGRRRGGRAARLTLSVADDVQRRDLTAGELAFVALPPGTRGEAQLDFPDPVRFGRRTKRASVQVTGGLAGLVVDLRDVPLFLPERRDRRRSRLAEWAAEAWPRDDR
ncbi:MAG: hypothetical protein ABI573_01555 [Chloroflexota bacterium]